MFFILEGFLVVFIFWKSVRSVGFVVEVLKKIGLVCCVGSLCGC